MASSPIAGKTELEIIAGRRAFGQAQKMLAGSAIEPARRLVAGWHSSSVDPESGSFAVIDIASGLDELVGEVVKVSYGRRSVFVYVLRAASAPADFSLTRRAYTALSRLSRETIRVKVEVVD